MDLWLNPLSILNETVIPVREVDRFPGKPSPSKMQRWHSRGIKSETGKHVQLESIKLGRERVTSLEAYKRFLLRLNGFDEQEVAQACG